MPTLSPSKRADALAALERMGEAGDSILRASYEYRELRNIVNASRGPGKKAAAFELIDRLARNTPAFGEHEATLIIKRYLKWIPA